MKPRIIIITGPTASGKSSMAMALARRFNGEIVNADSMQIYRYMDIGTAKPGLSDREEIPHHLIDIRDPDEDFDAAMYRDTASIAIRDIIERGRLPLVTGGSGLYIKSLLYGIFDAPRPDHVLRQKLHELAEEQGVVYLYRELEKVDPETAEVIDRSNPRRIMRALEVYHLTGIPISVHRNRHKFSDTSYDALKIGLICNRTTLYKRIDDRVDYMIETGFVDEVRNIIGLGFSPDSKAMSGIGYRQICGCLDNRLTLEEAIKSVKRDSRRYAKRQLTWFNADPEINWFDIGGEKVDEYVFSKVGGFVGNTL